MTPRRSWSVAVVVLLLATIARVALVQHLADQGFFAKYLVFADQILAGHLPRARLLDVSPGYLWFVVALRGLGFGVAAIRVLQIALLSAAALLAGIAARRYGAIAAVAAAAFVLTSRGALVCATEIEPETLILLFNAGALAAWMHERRMLAGALLGLSAICRPSAVLIVIALVIVARRDIVRFVAAAAVPIVTVLALNAVLTGEAALMDPGTVFYEGMNPNATGLAGVQPRIVNDLERTSRDPDTLHEAYRYVASRAERRAITRAESNRWWSAKAIAFARAYPPAALRLTGRKLLFALHAYEPYDLATMARKDLELPHWLFLPFSLLVGLAVVALLRRVEGIAPLVAFAIGSGIVLVVFYVTARQRNAMLPAIAVLAAVALTQRKIVDYVVAATIAVALSIPTPVQQDDAAAWRHEPNPFDAAIALENAGRWADADALLARLDDTQVSRENRSVSSVAYYRARAALHLGRDPRPFLARAERDAPGDAHVLAFAARLGDARARELLFRLHDPFTAEAALRE